MNRRSFIKLSSYVPFYPPLYMEEQHGKSYYDVIQTMKHKKILSIKDQMIFDMMIEDIIIAENEPMAFYVYSVSRNNPRFDPNKIMRLEYLVKNYSININNILHEEGLLSIENMLRLEYDAMTTYLYYDFLA